MSIVWLNIGTIVKSNHRSCERLDSARILRVFYIVYFGKICIIISMDPNILGDPVKKPLTNKSLGMTENLKYWFIVGILGEMGDTMTLLDWKGNIRVSLGIQINKHYNHIILTPSLLQIRIRILFVGSKHNCTC